MLKTSNSRCARADDDLARVEMERARVVERARAEMRRAEVQEVREGEGRNSALTIQARKSHVDSFAKGKLDADAFRKKASVTIY